MKKLMKKTMVVLLTVATLIGCMALSVSAAEQRVIKQSTVRDEEAGVWLMGYMSYYYDSANPNRISKVCAYTDFVAGSFASIITTSEVYVYSKITINFTDGGSVSLYSRSQEFILNSDSGVHLDDTQMFAFPYVVPSNRTIASIVSTHGVCTYYETMHNIYDEYFDDNLFDV